MTRVDNRTQYKAVTGVADHYAEIYRQLPIYQQDIVDRTKRAQARINLLDTFAKDRGIVPGGKMVFINPAGDGSRGKNSNDGKSGRGDKRYSAQRSVSGLGL